MVVRSSPVAVTNNKVGVVKFIEIHKRGEGSLFGSNPNINRT